MSGAYVITVHPDAGSWLAARRKKLTASEVPALLGCYPSEASKSYKNPYALWLTKTGEEEAAPDPDMELRFALAHADEPIIAQFVERRQGVTLVDLGDYTTVEEEGGFLMATPDRLISTPKARARVAAGHLGAALGPLQIKSARVAAQKDYEESGEFDYALAQNTTEMMVCGHDHGMVATCFGQGLGLDIYPLVRSEDLAALIRERAEEFWDFVTRGVPPSAAYIDDSEAIARSLRDIYRKDDGREVLLDPEVWLPLMDRRAELLEEIREAKKEVGEIDNLARAQLRTATYGRIPGYGKRWRWGTESRDGYTVEPSQSRVLRLVKA